MYPRLPEKNWWDLRNRARQSLPKEITLSYLATVLGISETTSKNLLPQLRQIGFADESGATTDLFKDWRDDDHYSDVCAQIRDRVYPRELLDALPPPDPDRDQARRWFARNASVGDSAAKQMTVFYALVCKADPAAENKQDTGARQSGGSQSRRRLSRASRSTPTASAGGAAEPTGAQDYSGIPSIHLDIQVHISPDASLDQIDQLFESMAKHLNMGRVSP